MRRPSRSRERSFPLNLSVMYRFSWATLESTLRYFFGEESIELGDDEPLGAALVPRPGLDLGSREAFQHFRILSTFQHEQYHVRHLVGSPFGLALFMLGGRQYAYARAYIQAWGERIGREGIMQIPAATNHGGDPEISDCMNMWHGFQLFQDSLQGDLPELSLLKATSRVLRPALGELQDVCSHALGREEVYPNLDVGELRDQPVRPRRCHRPSRRGGAGPGQRVPQRNPPRPPPRTAQPVHAPEAPRPVRTDGQPRGATTRLEASEYLVGGGPPLRLGAPASAAAVPPPRAELSLRPGVVARMEVRPAAIPVRGRRLRRRRPDAAATRGGGGPVRGPWVGQSVDGRRARPHGRVPRPVSVLTRHYVEGLQLAAAVRESEPDVMSVPVLGNRGYRLQAVYNIFTDRFMQGGTGRFTEDRDTWAIPARSCRTQCSIQC